MHSTASVLGVGKSKVITESKHSVYESENRVTGVNSFFIVFFTLVTSGLSLTDLVVIGNPLVLLPGRVKDAMSDFWPILI